MNTIHYAKYQRSENGTSPSPIIIELLSGWKKFCVAKFVVENILSGLSQCEDPSRGENNISADCGGRKRSRID